MFFLKFAVLLLYLCQVPLQGYLSFFFRGSLGGDSSKGVLLFFMDLLQLLLLAFQLPIELLVLLDLLILALQLHLHLLVILSDGLQSFILLLQDLFLFCYLLLQLQSVAFQYILLLLLLYLEFTHVHYHLVLLGDVLSDSYNLLLL